MGTHDLVTGRTDLSISSNNRALIAEIFGSIRKSAMAGVTAIVLVTLMLAACSRSGDISSSASTSTATSGELSVTASSESTVIASCSDETVVESTHVGVEIFCSDYGMPVIKVDDDASLVVADPDHPELQAAVDEICAAYEDMDVRYQLYRVDREILSFRIRNTEGLDIGYTLNMNGEVLSLQDVAPGYPEDCSDALELAIERNSNELHSFYTQPSDEAFSDPDVVWCIDGNSLMVFVEGLTYRIPFYGNEAAFAPELIEYDGEFFGMYCYGEMLLGEDVIGCDRGSDCYSEMAHVSLTINGEDVRILPDDLDDSLGYMMLYCYKDELGVTYMWLNHHGWWDEYAFSEMLCVDSGSVQCLYMDRNGLHEVDDLDDLLGMLP